MRLTIFLMLALGLSGHAFAHGGEEHSHDEPAPIARPANAAGAAKAEASQRLADGSVFVPKPAQRALGLRTAVAEKGEFSKVIELPGRVIADPNAGGRVQAAQAGAIAAGSNGIAVVGQRVSRGQALAWLVPAIDASSRADKQSSLAELSAQARVLEKRLARLEQLEGSVPAKEIEQARIELESLRARRSAIGGALGGRIALVAPVSGVVASSMTSVGQVVDAKELLFEIVDPNRLAVEALAFEAMSIIKPGRATARVGEFSIGLDFVGAGLALREQALPVLFRIRREAGGRNAPLLAIGQTVKVLAETGTKTAGVAAPVVAISRNDANESVIWVHDTAERFVPRRVKTLPLDADRVLVTEGLAGGERVVTTGASALGQVR